MSQLEDNGGNIPVVVLAAGASVRLGTPKQLITLGNATLLEKVLLASQEAQTGEVFVVIGHEAARIEQHVIHYGVHIVTNHCYREGLSTSVKEGMSAVLDKYPSTEAVILTLVDQPYLTASIFRQLASAFRTTSAPLVHCQYNRSLTGPPALVGRKFFAHLFALEGDTGAKKLFKNFPDDVATIDFPKGDRDIDTWEDLHAL